MCGFKTMRVVDFKKSGGLYVNTWWAHITYGGLKPYVITYGGRICYSGRMFQPKIKWGSYITWGLCIDTWVITFTKVLIYVRGFYHMFCNMVVNT